MEPSNFFGCKASVSWDFSYGKFVLFGAINLMEEMGSKDFLLRSAKKLATLLPSKRDEMVERFIGLVSRPFKQ